MGVWGWIVFEMEKKGYEFEDLKSAGDSIG
jgi:hypothetical protein